MRDKQVLCLRGTGFFPREILNDISGHYFSEDDRLGAESMRISDHTGYPREICITFWRPSGIEATKTVSFDDGIKQRFAMTGWVTRWQAPHAVLKRIRELKRSIS